MTAHDLTRRTPGPGSEGSEHSVTETDTQRRAERTPSTGKKPLFIWRDALNCATDLRPAQRHLLLAMSTFVDNDDVLCWASAETLHQRTGLAVATVRRIRTEVRDIGWLELVKLGGQVGEKRTANVYRLTIATRLPVIEDDPSRRMTRHPERDDPSSSTRLPVILRDPISKGSLNGSLRENAHAHFRKWMKGRYYEPEVDDAVELVRGRGFTDDEITAGLSKCQWPSELPKYVEKTRPERPVVLTLPDCEQCDGTGWVSDLLTPKDSKPCPTCHPAKRALKEP